MLYNYQPDWTLTVPLPFRNVGDVLVTQWPDGLFWAKSGTPDHFGPLASGYDFALSLGTPVFALGDGTVVESVNNVPDPAAPFDDTTNPFGNYVTIQYAYGTGTYYSTYAHLEQNTGLPIGTHVSVGDQVGRVGITGETTEPHLHLHFGLGLTTTSDSHGQIADAAGNPNICTFGNPVDLRFNPNDNEMEYVYGSRASLADQLNATPISLQQKVTFEIRDAVGYTRGTASWNTDDYYSVVVPNDGFLFIQNWMDLGGAPDGFIRIDFLDANGQRLNYDNGSQVSYAAIITPVTAGQTYYIHAYPGYRNLPYINTSASNPNVTYNANSYRLTVEYDTLSPIEPQSTLPVAIGGAATISHPFLWSVEPFHTADQLTYTILSEPTHGTLLDNGVAVASFTQADIDNGLVQYVENGDVVKSDSFTFQVSDPSGNHTETETFNIAILDHAGPVVTGGGKLSVAAGGVAPLLNPALDTVSLGNTPDQIAYTLLLPPEHGLILDNGVAATSFTQADIDSHRVQYVASGDGATSDGFIFQATDAAGNHTGPQPFAIQIQGTGEPALSGGGSTGTGGQPDHTFTFDDVSTLPGSGGADAPAPAAADMIDPAGSLALSTDTSTYDAMILWTLSYSSSSGSQG